jgi:hypothetical protein
MRSSWPRAAALVGVILVASVWASGWQRFTWGARLGTFGCAFVVLGVGSARARSRTRPEVLRCGDTGDEPSRIGGGGLALWLSVLAVAAVWDVLGLLTPPGRHHLTLSAIELAYRPLHGLLFALWLGMGWILASRSLDRQRN